MLKILRIALSIALSSILYFNAVSQSLGVNTTGAPAANSAILDVSSTDKGMLVPRMNKAQKLAITAPATGLLVFQESPDSIGFHFYNGSKWMWIDTASSKAGWLTTGNTGTDTAVHFLGTLDDKPLMLRQNNLWMGQLNSKTHNYFIGAASGFNNTANQNHAFGDSALFNNTTGIGNTAIGYRSMTGSGPITGNVNVAVGNNTLRSVTSGAQNVAIGDNAMGSMQTGSVNIAIGAGTMENASKGISNIAIGSFAQRFNDSASYNVAVGHSSLYYNDSIRNVAVGFEALAYNNRNDNLALGYRAGYLNNYLQTNPDLGVENTYVGFVSGYYPNTGNQNTALGYRALQGAGYFNADDPGNNFYKRNVAVGDSALTYAYGNDNVAIGFKTLTLSANTSKHTAVGSRALANTIATYPNTAVGYSSQDSATTGSANTSLGSYALAKNKTGFNNTAIGNAAMYEATSTQNLYPYDNTAVGNDALRFTKYYGHVAVGAGALRNDTSGVYNTAVGYLSMNNNLSGYYNVALGTSALRSNTTGFANTAIGTNSMFNHKSDSYNTSVGFESMINDTSGGLNTAIGWRSLRIAKSGEENTALGVGTLEFTDSSLANTAVGRGAMIGAFNITSDLAYNTSIGYYAGAYMDSVEFVSAVGAWAGHRNQGKENTFMGYNSGYGFVGSGLTGIENSGFGSHTLVFNTTGKSNTAIGLGALYANRTGNGNVGIGTRALANAQNYHYNIAIGDSAMYGNNADGNVAIGTFSMYNNNTGTFNTATGNYSLKFNSGGHRNVAMGDSTYYNNTNGSYNTGIGYRATNGSSFGINSTAIGAYALVNQDNSMVLGSINGVNTATADTKVGIGTTTPDSTFSVADKFLVGSTGTVQFDNSVPVMNYMFKSGTTNADRMILSHSPAISNYGIQYQDLTDKMNFLSNGLSVLTADLGTSRVGVGTSSPAAKLHVMRNGASGGTFIGNPSVIIEDNAQSYVQLTNPTNSENGILSGSAATTIRSGIVFGADSTVFLRSGGNNTRMTIDNNGYIGIGTTAPVTKLHINETANVNPNIRVSSVSSAYEPGVELVKLSGGADWKMAVDAGNVLTFSRALDDFVAAPTDYYQMSVASFRPATDNAVTLGTAALRWNTVYAFNGVINTSDARDKENIETLQYGLKEIMKLRPVSYNWKENPQWGRKLGFIAQEVKPILGEVIQTGALKNKLQLNDDDEKKSAGESDKLGIYYSDIIPVTVKAIQEQQTLIDKLEKENEALRLKNLQLEKDIQLIKQKLGITN